MSKCPVCDKSVGSENDTMLIHDGCIGEMIIRCERHWRTVADVPTEDGVVVLKHDGRYMFLYYIDDKFYIPNDFQMNEVYSLFPNDTWLQL